VSLPDSIGTIDELKGNRQPSQNDDQRDTQYECRSGIDEQSGHGRPLGK